MEHLETQIRELDTKLNEMEEEQTRVRHEREALKTLLFQERMKTLDRHKEFYIKKLERIKKHVDAFVGEADHRNGNLKYGFRKRELPYKDDSYDIMQDPLDFMIVEYDLLGMDDYLEVRVDYHSEAVKDFVNDWMRENIPHMYLDDDLFGFRV